MRAASAGLLAWWLVLAVLTALALQASAEENDPTATVVLRTSLDPPKAVIGQHVRLLVDVLFPGRMPAPPRVEAAQAPGLQVFRFESQGLTMRETINGVAHIGQRFEFAVYPRRAGELTIPPLTAELMDRSGEVTGKISSQAQTLAVSTPPGVDPSRPVIASTGVALSETWEPNDTKALRVGDALVRIVKRDAVDTPSLDFAPLGAGAPEGVRAYFDQPQANDKIEHGALRAERTDRITYVFERTGDYVLPPVSQVWWDLSANALKRVVGEGRRVSVAAPLAAKTGVGAIESIGGRKLAVAGLVALVLSVLGGLAVAALFAEMRRQRKEGPSEAALFARLKRAARDNDPATTYRALVAWREAAGLSRERVTALGSVQSLECALFAREAGKGEAFSDGLIGDLDRLRRKLRSDRKPEAAEAHLPPLNPAM